MQGEQTEKFESDICSPQGDRISGMSFNIQLENCLRRTRSEARGDRPLVEHSYYVKKKYENILDEETYADNTHFISLCEDEKQNASSGWKDLSNTELEEK